MLLSLCSEGQPIVCPVSTPTAFYTAIVGNTGRQPLSASWQADTGGESRVETVEPSETKNTE